MAHKIGSFVAHPNKPEWGHGEVLAVDGNRIRVFFSNAGEKIVDETYVQLAVVDLPNPTDARRVRVLPLLDLEQVRSLCGVFIADLKDNRATYNDASLAEHVLSALNRYGCLSRTTARQLAAWCTTNGAVFQKGVSTAQDISLAIYGRVLRREDVDAL